MVDDSKKISSPFPGIRSFEPHEHPIFFGREKHVGELIKMLLQKKFVAILGASGAGKSSLVKAGIIPSLQRQDVQKQWEVFYFNPGTKPIDNLLLAIDAMLQHQPQGKQRDRKQLYTELLTSEKALYQLFLDDSQNGNKSYFLYIDQFEEIFRFKANLKDNEVQAWIRNLIFLFHQDIPVYLTLSLRSDYLGYVVAFSGLSELINEANYLVPPLEQEDLRMAIHGPLSYFNLVVSDALVDEVLADLDNSLEHLLILQHVLMRTYREWKRAGLSNTPLDLQHYRNTGAIRNAISVHGEQVYHELPTNADKLICERIFKALSHNSLQVSEIKAPFTINQLAAIVGEPIQKVIEIADYFRASDNAFLYPLPHVQLTQFMVLDLAHEVILSKWERGRRWVEEEINAAELYMQLAKASELYMVGKGGLWVNPELALAVNWMRAHKPNEAWSMQYGGNFYGALNFLNNSEKEHQESIQRNDEAQRRKIAAFRNFAVFVGIAALLAVFLSVVALSLKFKAESSEEVALQNAQMAMQAKQEAEEKRQEAVAHQQESFQQQQIAEKQKKLAEEQKQFAIQQQNIAFAQKQNAEQQREIADSAKNEALKQKLVAELARVHAEQQRAKADSMRHIAQAQTKISERLRRLAVARSVAIQAVKIQQSSANDELAKVLAKEAYLLNKANDGPRYEPDIFMALSKAGNVDNVLTGHQDQVRAIQLLSNSMVITGSDDGQLLLWNVKTKQKTDFVNFRTQVKCYAFNRKHNMIFAVTNPGQVYAYNWLENTKTNITPKDMRVQKVCSANDVLVFLTNNNQLFASSYFTSATETATTPLADNVSNCLLSDNAELLAISLQNNELLILSTQAKWKELVRLQNNTQVQAMAFKTKAHLLAFSDDAFALKIWNYKRRSVIQSNIKHQSKINAISFSPKGNLIASCSYDGTIRFWDFVDGKKDQPVVIAGHDSWVHNLVFLHDGESLLSAGSDRTIRHWCIVPKKLADKITSSRGLNKWERKKYMGKDFVFPTARK